MILNNKHQKFTDFLYKCGNTEPQTQNKRCCFTNLWKKKKNFSVHTISITTTLCLWEQKKNEEICDETVFTGNSGLWTFRVFFRIRFKTHVLIGGLSVTKVSIITTLFKELRFCTKKKKQKKNVSFTNYVSESNYRLVNWTYLQVNPLLAVEEPRLTSTIPVMQILSQWQWWRSFYGIWTKNSSFLYQAIKQINRFFS